MNIITIREDLAAAIEDLEVVKYVSATLPDDVPVMPAVAVGDPESIDFLATMGLDRARFKVHVLAARADAAHAQQTLATLLSRGTPGNLIDALVGLRLPSIKRIQVVSAGDVGEYTVGQTSYHGASVLIDVLA